MTVIAKLRPRDETTATPEVDPPLSAMDRRVRPQRITPGRILGVLVIVAMLSAGGYGYARFGLERALTVDTARVTLSSVTQGKFADYVPVTGSIAPKDTVYLDITEGGQVTEVMVEDGVLVEAGQILARLKNTRLELDVLGREAQLTEQQNNLANARLALEQSELRNRRDLETVQFQISRLTDALDRLRGLGDLSSAADREALENELAHNETLEAMVRQGQLGERALAERHIEQLEQSISRMTRSLQLVHESLDDLSLKAPISGQLTAFDLNVGEVVGAGQTIGQIDTIGSFKATAFVDEFYLGRIARGQAANVELGSDSYALEVTKVYPNVADRQFRVDLEFIGELPVNLRRGQTIRPRIALGDTVESLVIDNGAFFEGTGGLWVFVVSTDGSSASRREVTLGRRNPEHVEVLAGLVEGEQVITSSYETFRDIERIDLD